MAAPKGNKFWQHRSKHGRDKLFETPEMLWDAAVEYFEWVVDNPLEEEELFHYQGKVIKGKANKMRPFTLEGLALYLDCSSEYLRHFEKNNKDSENFMPIITRIREVIYTQKFEGAAAGFLNPNIIARELGLKDSSDVTTNGKDIRNLSIEEAKELSKKLKDDI